ncbi:hypothetical protein C8R47DRAFT_1080468 [Mycena vitilis]|nr:hypothetical protein C8R47DRAFT_1080468 [Mycena vitilis]
MSPVMAQRRSREHHMMDSEVNELCFEYQSCPCPSSASFERGGGLFLQTEIPPPFISLRLEARALWDTTPAISIAEPTVILVRPVPPITTAGPTVPDTPTSTAPPVSSTSAKSSSTEASSAVSIPHVTTAPTSSPNSTIVEASSLTTYPTVAPTSPLVSASQFSSSSVHSTLSASSLSSDGSVSPTIVPAPLPTASQVTPSAAPLLSSSKKSVLSHGAIAGIACGILALLIISLLVLFMIRRAYRNKSVAQPVVLVECAPRRIVGEAINGKRAGGVAMHTNEAAGNAGDPVQLRQRLITQRIMTAQGELAALSVNGDTENRALRHQIEVLQHRIQTLKREQSQWALGLSEECPPTYIP